MLQTPEQTRGEIDGTGDSNRSTKEYQAYEPAGVYPACGVHGFSAGYEACARATALS